MNALARIGDALVVLLANFHPAEPLTGEEARAIEDLKDTPNRIANIKAKHRRPVVRPDAVSPSITSAA